MKHNTYSYCSNQVTAFANCTMSYTKGVPNRSNTTYICSCKILLSHWIPPVHDDQLMRRATYKYIVTDDKCI
jgi:hypothetical protein